MGKRSTGRKRKNIRGGTKRIPRESNDTPLYKQIAGGQLYADPATLLKSFSYAPLTQWLDAADPYRNGSRPGDGQVSDWLDKSGNNRDMTRNQGTIYYISKVTASKPQLLMPTMDFSNQNSAPDGGRFVSRNNFPKSRDVTVFIVGVLKPSVPPTKYQTFSSGTFWGHFNQHDTDIQVRRQGGNPWLTARTNNEDLAISNDIVEKPFLYSLSMSDATFLSVRQYLMGQNGPQTTSIRYGKNPMDTNNAPVYVGSSVPENEYSISYISEIIYYQKVLQPADINLVEGYLAWKWGFQKTGGGSLEGGHPYYTNGPFLTPEASAAIAAKAIASAAVASSAIAAQRIASAQVASAAIASAAYSKGQIDSAAYAKGQIDSAAKASGQQAAADIASAAKESAAYSKGQIDSAARASGQQAAADIASAAKVSAAYAQGQIVSAATASGQQASSAYAKGQIDSAAKASGQQAAADIASAAKASAAYAADQIYAAAKQSAAFAQGQIVSAAYASGQQASAAYAQGQIVSAANALGKEISAANASAGIAAGQIASAAFASGQQASAGIASAAYASGQQASAAFSQGQIDSAAKASGQQAAADIASAAKASAAYAEGQIVSAAFASGQQASAANASAVYAQGQIASAAFASGQQASAAFASGQQASAANALGQQVSAANASAAFAQEQIVSAAFASGQQASAAFSQGQIDSAAKASGQQAAADIASAAKASAAYAEGQIVSAAFASGQQASAAYASGQQASAAFSQGQIDSAAKASGQQAAADIASAAKASAAYAEGQIVSAAYASGQQASAAYASGQQASAANALAQQLLAAKASAAKASGQQAAADIASAAKASSAYASSAKAHAEYTAAEIASVARASGQQAAADIAAAIAAAKAAAAAAAMAASKASGQIASSAQASNAIASSAIASSANASAAYASGQMASSAIAARSLAIKAMGLDPSVGKFLVTPLTLDGTQLPGTQIPGIQRGGEQIGGNLASDISTASILPDTVLSTPSAATVASILPDTVISTPSAATVASIVPSTVISTPSAPTVASIVPSTVISTPSAPTVASIVPSIVPAITPSITPSIVPSTTSSIIPSTVTSPPPVVATLPPPPPPPVVATLPPLPPTPTLPPPSTTSAVIPSPALAPPSTPPPTVTRSIPPPTLQVLQDLTIDTNGYLGRYVRIRPATTVADGFIHFSQIMVFDASGTNVARGKLAFASSTMPGTSAPSILVDGSTKKRSVPNIWHSATSNRDVEYVEVDLGSIIAVKSIRLIGRGDCPITMKQCQQRMLNMRIEVNNETTDEAQAYYDSWASLQLASAANASAAMASGQQASAVIASAVMASGQQASAVMASGKQASAANASAAMASGQQASAAYVLAQESAAQASAYKVLQDSSARASSAEASGQMASSAQASAAEALKDRGIDPSNGKFVLPMKSVDQVIPTNNFIGRYVRIRPPVVSGDGIMNISQVMVFNILGLNLAKGAPTYAKSTMPGPASYFIVDGSTESRNISKTWQSAIPDRNNQFIEIDLGSPQTISAIRVLGRNDCSPGNPCEFRMLELRIEINMDTTKDVLDGYAFNKLAMEASSALYSGAMASSSYAAGQIASSASASAAYASDQIASSAKVSSAIASAAIASNRIASAAEAAADINSSLIVSAAQASSAQLYSTSDGNYLLPTNDIDQEIPTYSYRGRYIRIRPSLTDGDGLMNISQVMAYDANNKNVARSKVVYATSMMKGTKKPSVVTDGDTNPKNYPNIWQSSSINRNTEFLEIDLGTSNTIERIRIIGRANCSGSQYCEDRMLNLRIEIKATTSPNLTEYYAMNLMAIQNLIGQQQTQAIKTATTSNPSSRLTQKDANPGEFVFSLNTKGSNIPQLGGGDSQDKLISVNTKGRYIRLRPPKSNGDGYMNLSQIMVLNSKGKNIAAGLPIYSTSFMEGMSPPTILLDGSTTPRSPPDIWQSATTDRENEFVELDLGSVKMISSVQILGRNDCDINSECADRMASVRVEINKDTSDVAKSAYARQAKGRNINVSSSNNTSNSIRLNR